MRLRAAHYRSGRVFEFVFKAGRLVSREPAPAAAARLLFGPGFLDLQCNGFAGVDFNCPALSVEDVQAAVEAAWQTGCTQFLPTIITHQPERLEFLLQILARAAASRPALGRHIPVFHLEGPFLSPQDGARGAHPREAIRPISAALWRRLQRAAEGRIALVTLAPELRGACAFIQQLRREGVVPALGHTGATTAQVQSAASAGALLSTHLGNGCAPLLPRHENPIFAQLGVDELAASFIADGIHLPPKVLRALARAKGTHRSLLVTDAMAAAQAPPGRYSLGDLQLQVGPDRVVRQPGGSGFAGSSLSMSEAVANFSAMAKVSLAEAWDAASRRPRSLLARAHGSTGSAQAGLAFAYHTLDRLEIVATVLGRQVLWRRS